MRWWVVKSKRLGYARSSCKKLHCTIDAVQYYAVTLLQRYKPVYLPENAMVVLVRARVRNTSADTSQWTD